jgi:hypothetical protein
MRSNFKSRRGFDNKSNLEGLKELVFRVDKGQPPIQVAQVEEEQDADDSQD